MKLTNRPLIQDGRGFPRPHGDNSAGDMVTGPATVIEAIAAGHQTANAVRRYLETGRLDERSELRALTPPKEFGLLPGRMPKLARTSR